MSILDHIYEAATDEAAFLALPGHLARAVGARSAMIQTLSPDFQVERLDFNHFTPEMNAYFLEHQLWEHDLWLSVAVRHGFSGIVRSCDDYIAPEEFRSSVLFNDFLRHFGDDTFHCLGTMFRTDRQRFGLGIQRGDGAGAFGQGDVDRVQMLMPHLQRLLILRERLATADAETLAAREAMDGLGVAILQLGGSGQVVFANRQAERILRAQDGISLSAGRIALRDTVAEARLEGAVRQASLREGARGGALTVPRRSDANAYRLIVAPLGEREDGGVLVLIDAGAETSPALADTLKAMFGLSGAETDLALGLTKGLTPEEVAEQRDVSLNTVRTQVRSILAKLERRRLTEAVSDLSRIAALQPPKSN